MQATIETTQGTIEVELFEKEAPITVNNFVSLAKSNFFSDLVFHRIVKGFVIQTGDPNTRGQDRSSWGMGGSAKNVSLEIVSSLHNYEGYLGMARSSDPNSGSSQFYINLANNTSLDGQYAVFGRVTQGMQVVDSIANLPVDGNDAPRDPSKAMMKQVTIKS